MILNSAMVKARFMTLSDTECSGNGTNTTPLLEDKSEVRVSDFGYFPCLFFLTFLFSLKFRASLVVRVYIW